MLNEEYLNSLINRSIKDIFKNAIHISIREPLQAKYFLKIFKGQKEAAKRRAKNEKLGIQVPAFMIVSLTHKCNLRCKGCYSKELHISRAEEMSSDLLERTVNEARELGIGIVLLAGGEPLVRKWEIVQIASRYPDVLFPMFTNGMLIDDDFIVALKHQRNIIPIMSLEGKEEATDYRRGAGVFEYIKSLMIKLSKEKVFYGTSITLTRDNYELVTSDSFVEELMNYGCKTFVYVEYVPINEELQNSVLTQKQKEALPLLLNGLRNKYNGLFFGFPGDEDIFGGCLAAGRGFIHINPQGNIEPCPFAPFSDANIKEKTLKEALQSEFLMNIRNNHHLLKEGQGGCILWENRAWVESILKN